MREGEGQRERAEKFRLAALFAGACSSAAAAAVNFSGSLGGAARYLCRAR